MQGKLLNGSIWKRTDVVRILIFAIPLLILGLLWKQWCLEQALERLKEEETFVKEYLEER